MLSSPVRGQLVLDLGCAVGDQAAEFVARGARVIGVDIDDKLIDEARSRKLANADFRQFDLRTLPDLGVMADGLWCSFSAALTRRGCNQMRDPVQQNHWSVGVGGFSQSIDQLR